MLKIVEYFVEFSNDPFFIEFGFCFLFFIESDYRITVQYLIVQLTMKVWHDANEDESNSSVLDGIGWDMGEKTARDTII